MAEKRTRRRFTAEFKAQAVRAAARGRQAAVGGRDRAGPEPRAAEPVAQRAPGGRLGGGARGPQGGAGGDAAAEAREQAARGGGRDPQEGRGFFRPGDRVTRFAFVAAERANHAVARLCRVVGASVSGFYAWLRAIPAVQDRAEAEAELRGHIGRIFAAPRRVYGSPAGPRRAAPGGPAAFAPARRAADARDGPPAPAGRRRTPRTTDSRHDLPVAPNLLDRNFAAERPDSGLARRHHLHSDRRGLAVPGRDRGPGHARDRRLVAWPTTCGPGCASTRSSWPCSAAIRPRADPPQRPRRAAWVQLVVATPVVSRS